MKRRWIVPILLSVAFIAVLGFARTESPAIAGEDPEFLSQKGCKKCHFKQHRSWKKTVHAKALDVLKAGEKADIKKKFKLDPEKDYTKDATCLKCHVTGYGQPGGYPAVKDAWSEDEQKLAKANAGVGCEMCHGAGSKYGPYKKDHEDYKRADVVALGLKTPVTADNCTGCHTAEGNPTALDGYTFDFEKSMKEDGAIHDHQELKNEH